MMACLEIEHALATWVGLEPFVPLVCLVITAPIVPNVLLVFMVPVLMAYWVVVNATAKLAGLGNSVINVLQDIMVQTVPNVLTVVVMVPVMTD